MKRLSSTAFGIDQCFGSLPSLSNSAMWRPILNFEQKYIAHPLHEEIAEWWGASATERGGTMAGRRHSDCAERAWDCERCPGWPLPQARVW